MLRIFAFGFLMFFWTSFVLGQEPSSPSVFDGQWTEQKASEETKKDLIFPNPTYGILNFDLSNLIEEENENPFYRVVIRNVIAKEIFSVVYYDLKFKHNFGFLEKGTYLLGVENKAGKHLFARRLVIITP